jgi:hypothetical protein
LTARRWMPVLAVVTLAIATGCAQRSPAAVTAPSSTSSTPSPSPIEDAATTWFVVLRVANDPAGVREDAAALGPMLGGAIQVAPGSCFNGLPGRFGGDRYVLGAVGNTNAEVDRFATRAHIEPLFEGEVQVVCTD